MHGTHTHTHTRCLYNYSALCNTVIWLVPCLLVVDDTHLRIDKRTTCSICGIEIRQYTDH